MIRNQWTVGLRNKLSEILMECDSYSVIKGAWMSQSERKIFQKKLEDCISWIDKKILPRA